MLKELRVRNYAVIDDLAVEPGPGLNVLTGETGAGKSIIVGALSLLLGERASSDVVRSGRDRATVEAAFDLAGHDDLLARCAEAGIEVEDDWLILRREVQREGRNRAWINGSPATAGLIWELGSRLVEVHGQHEGQALLRDEEQRRILDAYAGATDLAGRVAETHGELRETLRRIETLRTRGAELRERADYLRFKAREIEEAGLEEGEDERLEAEARRLEHSEELMELSGGLQEAIYGDEGSIVDRLGELRRPLRELLSIDSERQEFEEMYESARAALQELGRELAAYHGDVDHDPSRLASLRARLDEIYRLQRKYGDSVEAVLEAGRTAREELRSLEGSDARIEELEARAGELRERLAELCDELTGVREEAAGRLSGEVEPLLEELSMEGGRFEVELLRLEEPAAHGAETLEFLISLNPGFPPAPLSRIASGGELSRVMLALKTVLARVDRVPSLIFDEIDAGVGGKVGRRVAERLARVAGEHQVFVITHLPQIAARADVHLRVEKSDVEGRAATRLTRLEDDGRIREVARMLGGDAESASARDHARELLDGGDPATRDREPLRKS